MEKQSLGITELICTRFTVENLQVSHTWLIRNGLLFERTLTHAEMKSVKKNCPSQTIFFSMLHPLDEVAPVITKISAPSGSPKISYFTDSNVSVIFTNCEPSIAVTFDSLTGLHSVWRIRRARQELTYTHLSFPGPYVYLNVQDQGLLARTCVEQDIGCIVHYSAILSADAEANTQRALDINIIGLHNLLEVSRQLNLKLFVPSTIGM
uniref:NAD-dependent epimerase/dehydratase domain-containing protein n=1 Tax=Biomphalaria glabrata TaxID=6526 RepID=A0A2C9LCI8_BIOGL